MKVLLFKALVIVQGVLGVISQSCPIFAGNPGKETERTNGIGMDKGIYNISICPENQVGDALHWESIADVKVPVKCNSNITEPIQVYPQEPVLKAGLSLPGDFCLEDYHCRSQNFSRSGEMKGEDSVCKSGNSVGDHCEDHYDGPPNSYCSQDKVCNNITQLGEDCTELQLCAYNQLGVANETSNFNKFYCERLFTFEDGQKYVPSPKKSIIEEHVTFFKDPRDILILSYACKTGYAVLAETTGDIYEGRNGDQSSDLDANDLKRENPGELCEYHSFTDPLDHTKPIHGEDRSKGGFNRDGFAWCPMRSGDRDIMEAYREFVVMIGREDTTCHIKSEALRCNSLLHKMRSRVSILWYFAQLQASGNFTNVANNDICAATSITGRFWAGRFIDFATRVIFQSMAPVIFALYLLVE